MNDEAVVRLRNEMFSAADADINENEEGKYAIHKLRMLPTVVDMMQRFVLFSFLPLFCTDRSLLSHFCLAHKRASLAESLVDNGLLEAVKRWLEPLPDKSLPAVNIQRPLFEILRNVSTFLFFLPIGFLCSRAHAHALFSHCNTTSPLLSHPIVIHRNLRPKILRPRQNRVLLHKMSPRRALYPPNR